MSKLERAAMQQALEACKRNQSAQAQAILEEALAGDNMTPTEQVELNLNCKSVQARLATSWGYVKAEQADEEGKITDYMLGFSDGKHYAHKYEQAEQSQLADASLEPVAWWHPKMGAYDNNYFDAMQPLYLSPVRTKDLTDDDLCEIEQKCGYISHDNIRKIIALYEGKKNG